MVFGKMGFSKKTREEVYNKTNGHCAYCGCKLPKRWHIDHVMPINRGIMFNRPAYMDIGTDDIDNLLPACPTCNINKSNLSVETYRQSILSNFTSLFKAQPMFRAALHYGVIKHNPNRFEFYFEKQGIQIKGLYEYEIAFYEHHINIIQKRKEEYKDSSFLINAYELNIKEYTEIINYYKVLVDKQTLKN